MDFERIDINQCPISAGNSGPNRFADTAKCKEKTTLVSSFCKDNFSLFKLIFLDYM